jgi:hypothetical protein
MTGMDVLGLSISDPGQQKTTIVHPYSTSTGSSASSSSSSIFSLDGISSQSSIASSTSAADVIWENEESSARGLPSHSENASHCLPAGLRGCPSKATDAALPAELRKHPRRSGSSAVSSNGPSATCSRLPPPLVRQCERKVSFVDNLVGKS